jgi:hypothetical protein
MVRSRSTLKSSISHERSRKETLPVVIHLPEPGSESDGVFHTVLRKNVCESLQYTTNREPREQPVHNLLAAMRMAGMSE